ncbi:MAG: hypothetical protein R3220_08490 [Balneolaceae bacterium]|nr:hypothetical protein [Balneolaceae bacterium]
MKLPSFILLPLVFVFILSDCGSTNIDSDNILHNRIGTLSWKGSPAVDGAGMLFIVGDTEYGAPGTPDDYTQYFDTEDY